MLLDKCLADLVFCLELLCALQRFSTFLSVSQMYSPHEHLLLYITQEICGVLLLTLDSDFTFLVIHLIAILYRLLVHASNFLIKCLEAFLFSSQ